MKKKQLFFVVLVGAVSFGAVAVSFAQGNGERMMVGSREVIEGDYVATGETVEIAGTVKGDVYVLGGQVLVSGTVEGDLLAFGGVISISGNVEQNVRAAGWQIILSGNTGRNATLGGMNIELTQGSRVGGNVVAGGTQVLLNGPIGKTARIAGRTLVVTSTIGGDTEAAVEIIRLAKGADIQGNFTYWSNRDASIADGVAIAGAVTQKTSHGPGAYIERLAKPLNAFANSFLALVSFFSSLILGYLLIHLMPNYARQTVLTLREHKWRCLTNGITTLLIIPIIFGILIITIVGIPLGFVLLLLSSFVLYLARIFVMLWLGMIISEKIAKNVSDTWAFGIGLIAYTFLTQLPFVGWVVSFGAVLLGLGAAAQVVQEKYFVRPSAEKL